MQKKAQLFQKAFKTAFPLTLPIMAGFLFLGFSYGVYMNASGFSFIYPAIMSLIIFGGSLEFIAVQMLLSPFAPLQTALMTLMIQARHLFYGISMLDKYSNTGKMKPYLIFGMCDETFSINCSAQIPHEVDKGLFMLIVTLLNHSYWFIGSSLGGLVGSLISFNTKGIDFVMTAMFVVIFLDNWLKENQHASSLIGLCSAIVCLLIFGADSFMIPTMLCILAALSIFRSPIEGRWQK